jgi:hypothetical protein
MCHANDNQDDNGPFRGVILWTILAGIFWVAFLLTILWLFR